MPLLVAPIARERTFSPRRPEFSPRGATATPAAASVAARHAPLVTTEVLTGAGHGLINEAPEQTSSLV